MCGVQTDHPSVNLPGSLKKRIKLPVTGREPRRASIKLAFGDLPNSQRRLLAKMITQMLACSVERTGTFLLGSVRGSFRCCRARQTAIYLLHTNLSLTYSEIGKIYKRDRTTIAHACKVIEDLRDKPCFDDWVGEFEDIIGKLKDMCGTGYQLEGSKWLTSK